MWTDTIADSIVYRDWDSGFFGFTVGEITDPDATDESLCGLLQRGRIAGARLLYWAARDDRPVDELLLARLGGRCVDRKITYSRNLAQIDRVAAVRSLWRVEEVPEGPPPRALAALAVVAGVHSRFRVDPGIPPGKFEELYRLWMERSTRREIADVVLAATNNRQIAGMSTIAVDGAAARIGLFAVDPQHQRHGVGARLIDAAHAWMEGRGVRKASVVTQAANEAACRHYEKSGYAIEKVCRFYHFWPEASV